MLVQSAAHFIAFYPQTVRVEGVKKHHVENMM